MIDTFKLKMADGLIKDKYKVMNKSDYLDYCIELLENETDKLAIFDILINVIQEFNLIDYNLEDIQYFDTFDIYEFAEDNCDKILKLLHYVKEKREEEGIFGY